MTAIFIVALFTPRARAHLPIAHSLCVTQRDRANGENLPGNDDDDPAKISRVIEAAFLLEE